MLQEATDYLVKLDSIRQSPDFDVQASIQNLFRKTLPGILLLVAEDDSSEFGVRMQREIITFCENIFMILVKCIGLSKTQNYLTEIGNLAMTGKNGEFLNISKTQLFFYISTSDERFSRLPRYLINTYLIDRRSFDLSEIQEFLVVKRPAPETVAV